MRAALTAACALSIGALAGCAPAGTTRTDQPLTPRQLQTPGFDPPPPAESYGASAVRLAADFERGTAAALLARMLPGQGGVLWVALIVAVTVGLDLRRVTAPRNVELLGLLLAGFLMFDIMRFFGLFGDPTYWNLMDWVFGAIVTVSLGLLARALWRMRYPLPEPWQPNLARRVLIVLTAVLLMHNVLSGVLRPPDDAGFYTNLGAQRLRERGLFPYGDPLLTGSPAAAYGPVLYLAHLPFQWMLSPTPVNPPLARPRLDAESPYYLPPDLATRLTTVSFHLLGVAALVIAGRRLAGVDRAWAIAALYCGSAYVMGVGGDREPVGGVTFISHIAPVALTLAGFAAVTRPRPMLAGSLLAAGMAALFYPAFFFPAWLGYHWHARSSAVRFVAGFALASLAIGVPVLVLSRGIEGRSVLATVLHETQGHQQDLSAYGSSPFGFWGQRGGVRAALRDPLIGDHPNTSPLFLAFAAFVGASFFLARRRGPAGLALLTGALGIAAQLWKVHGTGLYVTWYYPFLLLGFFGAPAHAPTPAARPSDVPTGLVGSPLHDAGERDG